MTSVKQALQYILPCAKSFGKETISIHKAQGRVLAQAICADRDYPPFNRSAMDGYAVRAADFENGATASLNVIEHLLAGSVAEKVVSEGNCIKIMTGAPVPKGADAVIKVEECIEDGGIVKIKSSGVKPWKNIAQQGEDAGKGKVLIPEGVALNAPEMSVLAVTGSAEVEVEQLPKVAIISTGNEIVAVDKPILAHQIRDSNSYALKALFQKYNISDVDCLHILDDKEVLKTKLADLLNKDLLILSGGVSKGDADYVPEVLQSLGVKELFHRVRIKPGAPLWFGKMPNGGVVFGLPGNPVAVQVAFKVFIEPFLRSCFSMEQLSKVFMPIATKKKKGFKFDQYFPCKMVMHDNCTHLKPNTMNGSGDIAATLGSDGIALHPADSDLLAIGTPIEFIEW